MYVSPDGQQFEKRYGNRVAVWEMRAHETSSGLLRKDLKENRRGRIVSIRRSALMLERYREFGGLKRKEKEEAKEVAEEKKASQKRQVGRLDAQGNAGSREEAKVPDVKVFLVPGQKAQRRNRRRHQ